MNETVWWGQSCDSCDWIIKNKMEPNYEVDDWVISRDVGAYVQELS